MTAASAATDEPRPAPQWGTLLAVLGVVYGDIGTSPLYAFKSSLHHVPGGSASPTWRSWASCR